VPRKVSFVALALVAAVAGPAHADPVDDVRHIVATVVGRDLPPGIILPSNTVHSAVVGYILVSHQQDARPTFQLMGALSNPSLWTCADNYPAAPYSVTCLPVSGTVLDWHCDVLHGDISTLSANAVARTVLDCDGGATPPEVETAVVSGTAGHDSKWSPSPVLVTAFSCTVDAGPGAAASPDFTGGCGDPGAPSVG
jgi:hypothetical protein